jgi:hypothetical protein
MAEKKAVALRGPTGLAVQGQSIPIEGFEGIAPAAIGLRPPMLRIDHAKARWKLGTQELETVRVVFLKLQRFREYTEMDGKRLVRHCASSDGVRPHEYVPEPKSELCAPCPYGQWSEDPNTRKRIRPSCDEGIAFFGVWPEGKNLPWWLLTKRSSIKAAKEFAQAVVNENVTTQINGGAPIRGFYDLTVTLGLRKEANGSVTYYTPTFKFERHPTETGDKYREFYLAAREQLFVPPVEGGEIPGGEDDEASEAAPTEGSEPSSVPF